MLFRFFLMSWSLLLTTLLLWMATHNSTSPTILGRYSTGYAVLLLGISSGIVFSVAAQFGVVYRYLFQKREKLLLLVSSIFVSVLLAEIGVRVLDPLGVSYLEEISRYHLDKIPDDSRIYKHKPGLKKVYQGVEVTTNAMGLRDKTIWEKETGELRLLLLGDSITFGWGVADEHTYARKLEAILRMKLNRHVTTINSGVGSYNTWQEYNFLADFIDVLQPDMVSLLYNANDIQMVYPPFDPWSKRSLRGKSPPETIDILLRKSWLCRLFIYYPLAVAAYARKSEIDVVDHRSEGRRQSMDYLKKMAKLCGKRNIPFITFYYQGIGGMTKLDQSLFSEMLGIGKKNNFHVFKAKSYNETTQPTDVVNSRVDSHPNKYGHQLLAEMMAFQLLEHGLIPQ